MEKKKAPKKAAQIFENIIKASVAGNPKPKKSKKILKKIVPQKKNS